MEEPPKPKSEERVESEIASSEFCWIERPDFHLKVVQEISDLINQSTDLETVLKGVIEKISRSICVDVVSLYLWDEQKKELILRSTRGLTIDPQNPIRLKTGEGLTGYVFETRRAMVVMPASSHPRYKLFKESGEMNYESYLGVPIVLQDKCLGVLVGQISNRRLINPAEQTLFQIIASRLAGLLEVTDRLDRMRGPAHRKSDVRAFQGKGLSGGFAVGPVYLFRGLFQEIPSTGFKATEVSNELARLEEALQKVEKDLKNFMQTLGKESNFSESEINIFQAHLVILRDFSFREAIFKRIREKGMAAEEAVVETAEAIASQFENHEERYLKDRGNDFRDLGEKILRYLLELRGERHAAHEPLEGSILVAQDLGPSVLASLHKRKIAGIITEKGGETSHTAIIARSLGIPAVAGVDNICQSVRTGETLLVDGKTGFIFQRPEKSLITEYENTHKKFIQLKQLIEKDEAAKGPLGVPVEITANIGFPADIEIAKQYHVKSVGLFRTEFTFMQHDHWPTVPEQTKLYEEVAKNFDGFITIRTLDIGADKLLPYFNFPKEANPLLGLRSIRFSMEYLDLFRDQIKAILLNVKKGHRFRILLPMVSNVWEVETARDILEECAKEVGLDLKKLPSLGALVEVPAILHQIEDYKDVVDFISVGTNDLVQYLLAVDRDSSIVGHLYSAYHPAVVRALDFLSSKAKSFRENITICGEMAGTPAGALALMALGFWTFSVIPARVPVIRYLVKRVKEETLKTIREKILSEKKPQDIVRFLSETLEKIDPVLTQLE